MGEHQWCLGDDNEEFLSELDELVESPSGTLEGQKDSPTWAVELGVADRVYRWQCGEWISSAYNR
jgi:hypothetical protein